MSEELIKRLREQSNKATTSDYVGALMREAIAAIESRPAPAVQVAESYRGHLVFDLRSTGGYRVTCLGCGGYDTSHAPFVTAKDFVEKHYKCGREYEAAYYAAPAAPTIAKQEAQDGR